MLVNLLEGMIRSDRSSPTATWMLLVKNYTGSAWTSGNRAAPLPLKEDEFTNWRWKKFLELGFGWRILAALVQGYCDPWQCYIPVPGTAVWPINRTSVYKPRWCLTLRDLENRRHHLQPGLRGIPPPEQFLREIEGCGTGLFSK